MKTNALKTKEKSLVSSVLYPSDETSSAFVGFLVAGLILANLEAANYS